MITTETIPLRKNANGVILVANTRVTLDTVVETFKNGATAEEIVHKYPSLDLADVYYVIGYYLRQRDEVERYLEKRREESARVREENERRFDPNGLRDRLLARRLKKTS
jgi:uncharacterized protein (DUF433 family)